MANVITKIVNVYPTQPIFSVTPVIRNITLHQEMSLADIKLCILRHAKVEEVLKDGSVVQLDLNTIELDNAARIAKEKEERDKALLAGSTVAVQLEKANKLADDLVVRNKQLESEVAGYITTIDKLNEDLEKVNGQVSDLTNQLAESGKETEATVKIKIDELNAKLTKSETNLSNANKTINSLNETIEKLNKDLAAAKSAK